MTENKIEAHQWVRIKTGDYKDDLGLVETVEGNNKAWVRLIPRNRQPVIIQKTEDEF
jgi:transcription elongation factor